MDPHYRRITSWTDIETRILLDKYVSYLPEIGPMKEFPRKRDMWMKLATEFKDKSWKQCEERFKTVMKRKKTMLKFNILSTKRMKRQHEEESEEENPLEPDIGICIPSTSKKIASETVPKVTNENSFQETFEEVNSFEPETGICIPSTSTNSVTETAPKVLKERSIQKTFEVNHFEPETEICIPSTSKKCATEMPPKAPKDKSIQEILLEIAARKEEAKEKRHRERMEIANQMQYLLTALLLFQ